MTIGAWPFELDYHRLYAVYFYTWAYVIFLRMIEAIRDRLGRNPNAIDHDCDVSSMVFRHAFPVSAFLNQSDHVKIFHEPFAKRLFYHCLLNNLRQQGIGRRVRAADLIDFLSDVVAAPPEDINVMNLAKGVNVPVVNSAYLNEAVKAQFIVFNTVYGSVWKFANTADCQMFLGGARKKEAVVEMDKKVFAKFLRIHPRKPICYGSQKRKEPEPALDEDYDSPDEPNPKRGKISTVSD